MMKINKPVVFKICALVGIALLVIGVLVLIGWQWDIHSCAQKSDTYVETLRELIPEPRGAIPEERRDNSMPVLDIDETDFIGILEMPRYRSALPVSEDWGSITKYPCRFSGSIYDRSMKIGVTSQKGQFDFYREISVGDVVIFVDVEGNRYTYTVTDLQYESHADQTTLNSEESALTLFIKNVYDFDYLMVHCDVID